MTQTLCWRSLLTLTSTCLLAICTAAVAMPSFARADYTVTWCQNGANPPLVSNVTGAQSFNQIEYECTGSQPKVAFDGSATNNGIGEPGGVLSADTMYGIELSTPADTGLTISHLAMTLVSQPYGRGPQAIIEVEDTQGIIFSHQLSATDTNWTYDISQTMSANDRTITIREYCPASSPSETGPCSFHTPKSILAITAISLTLHDEEQPTLYLTGGELLLAGAHSGTDVVTFSAAAPESGVAEVDAYLGSTLVGSDAYQSTQCSYTRYEPCPPTVSDSIPIDTTNVPDGSYPLVLEARDASGNTVSTPWSVPITVANKVAAAGGPPGTGTETTSGPGAPNGRSATSKAQIGYFGTQQGKIKARHGQSVSFSGHLTNQTGTPIPSATLDVLSQTTGSNEPFVVLGHTTTNADGVFTFRVPAGPSRVIRTGYRAFANDSGYDATTDLTEKVTATTTLSVEPRRLRGRTFTFRGKIYAGNFPPGQQVEFQVLIGNSWSHVAFATVAADGHFKVRYRLKHHYAHVTFAFRAIPVASPIWPYEPQQSNHAQLHLL
jgi:hypothetical protein